MIKLENIINKLRLKHREVKEVYIDEEEYDMITDEIEKSLLEIKDAYGIPTEEIEKSVLSRRDLRKTKNTR
tara:strand:+ start:320 stop:532 length:213 start_codon:yes stop_codon:yes gene_type:complete